MDTRSAPPTRRPWPLGFLGMVVLLILGESYVARRARDFMGDAAYAWRWGARSADRNAKGSEILCVGDSTIKFGIAPRVIESRTGRSVWNLAVTGGRPASSYFLFRRALNAGARPSALIVDAEMLDMGPFDLPYVWPELATPLEALEMAWIGRQPNFFAHYCLAWALPSARGRFEIRSNIMAATRGETTTLGDAASLYDRNWKVNRGASILPATCQLSPSAVTDIDAWPPKAPITGQWTCEAANATYLDKLFDLAAARQIPVFWVFPPHYRNFDRYLDRPNWCGAWRQFARERLDRYPNIVAIDGLHANYDRTAVTDVAHLNRRGAVAFSTAVGDILRQRLASRAPNAPRWIELPTFTEPPAESPVEDWTQSVAVVQQKKKDSVRR